MGAVAFMTLAGAACCGQVRCSCPGNTCQREDSAVSLRSPLRDLISQVTVQCNVSQPRRICFPTLEENVVRAIRNSY